MKTIPFAPFLAFLTAVALIGGCAKPSAKAPVKPADVASYTCTMHPSVRPQDPDGKCPICGMDLVPVKKTDAQLSPAPDASAKEADPAAPREFTVPLDRQQLIGVTFATAEMKPLRRTIRAVGTVAVTTAKHWDYVARVAGYIHDLYISAPGDRVRPGQVLMDLYSPDLVATETEIVDLLRMRAQAKATGNVAAVANAQRLLAAARSRLGQWNISPEQIAAIEKAGQADEYLPLTSPVSGFVEAVGVHQGRHVSVGDHLADLVDLSAVWVWAEFYEDELPLLRPGLPVTITSVGLPGYAQAGKIALIDPFIEPVKRTGRVRIDVDNAALNLRPGAYVDVTVAIDAGRGLTVPTAAVLPTGEHNLVFVDKGGGKLEPRYVQLGGRFGDDDQVTAGLRAGERVVSSANFLIDAEAKVQGALKDF